MNYRITEGLKKNRKVIIIGLVLWAILTIVLVLPFTIAKAVATTSSGLDLTKFIQVFGEAISNPTKSIGFIFKVKLIGNLFKNWFFITIVYLIFFIIGFVRTMPKHQYDNIEHGSSDWSQRGEQYKILSNKQGIILAENNYLPVDKQGNVNVLVVGGSGSGKSASYSIPNAYQLLGSYVFTDPKGELYDRTAGFLKQHGYKIKVFNLVHPQYSDGYNPLMHVASEIDVDVIAHTIVKGQRSADSTSDPFWDDSAETLLKALIYYLLATRPEEEQNLASCAELVRAANSNGGSNLLTELMSQLPYDHPARMNYKSIEIAPEKTYNSILSTLQSKLGKFDSKDIAELTSTDTIDFEDIGREKTAVYVISPDTHTTYNFLLTIFFAQMIQQLYDFADNNGGKLTIPTYFILDEFANIGQIPDFDQKISTSRSRRISFSVILQNLDQLEAIYDKSYETIIGNCDTHVFLGSNSQKTVEYFSKALGEKTISHYSTSVNRDKGHHKQGYSNSDQIMARALMTPDELRRMDNDLCIIFVKGLRPIKADKFYYFKKPMAKELAKYEISHNDIGEIERGIWRKYNPYNPYVPEEEKQKKADDLKIESLDDLFEEETKKDEKPKEEKREEIKDKENEATNNPDKFSNLGLDDLFDEQKNNQKQDKMQLEELKSERASEKPDDKGKESEEEYDLQKELEAKFDELFGPIDSND
ncbi:MAG: type IV secretory system conjugative DNA transfer family protein [Clostridia bacterium]|nr:type IV secretory system conjugative DNA transfer family protein [Clostridia bacterium]